MDDTETTPARVKFGAREDDTMPVTWAERGLKWLRENRQNVFMDMMQAVYGIEKKPRGNAKKNGHTP